jgi:Predicted membrane protein
MADVRTRCEIVLRIAPLILSIDFKSIYQRGRTRVSNGKDVEGMISMQDYAEIATKLAIAFAGLWAMTRLLGKREIAQLTPFDFVSSLVLGDLVGNTIYDEQASFWKLLFALAFWTALSYAFEKVMEFGKPFRRRLEGRPELLIVDGEIDLAAMKRNSMELEELRMMLRQKDVFSVSEVAYAIYETNGSLSVLRKSAYEEVSRSDLHLDSPKGREARSDSEREEL